MTWNHFEIDVCYCENDVTIKFGIVVKLIHLDGKRKPTGDSSLNCTDFDSTYFFRNRSF